MTADKMQGDSWRDLRRSVMKTHAPVMNSSHGRDDVFDFERMAQYTVAHASTSAVRHFRILDVEPRSGEEVDAAGVVEMHVRQDDIANNGGVDADAGEHLFDRSQDHATWTPRCSSRVHPGVHKDGTLRRRADRASDHPNEIVKRHGRVMSIRRDEILPRRPVLVGGVA
jgi:hypothetical protein